MRWLLFALIVQCSLACGTRTLPPPERPDRAVPPSPVPTRDYDVLLLSSDEPATVGRDGATLCAQTPCVVSLAPGEHDLEFQSLEDDDRRGSTRIAGLRQPSVVKQTMGEARGRGVASGFGYALIPLGVLSFAAGVIANDLEEISDHHCESDCGPDRTRSTILLSAGLAAMIGGFALLVADEPTYQRATTIHWTP